MKTALVTGAAGFIGYHLCQQLLLRRFWSAARLVFCLFVGHFSRHFVFHQLICIEALCNLFDKMK